jgi:hypothetical protein
MTAICGVILPIVILLTIPGGVILAAHATSAVQEIEGVLIAGLGLLILTAFHCTEMVLREIKRRN